MSTYKCQGCGNTWSENVIRKAPAFCIFCGGAVGTDEVVVRCVRCGRQGGVGRFCEHCGGSLTQVRQFSRPQLFKKDRMNLDFGALHADGAVMRESTSGRTQNFIARSVVVGNGKCG